MADQEGSGAEPAAKQAGSPEERPDSGPHLPCPTRQSGVVRNNRLSDPRMVIGPVHADTCENTFEIAFRRSWQP